MSSIEKIINNPQEETNQLIKYISIGILATSILVKLWMAYFYNKMAKIIHSVALVATSKDSRNDCISTTAILIGTIVTLIWPNIPFSLDGVLGTLVSIFILISGIFMIKEATSPLIGETIEYDFVKEIVEYILSFDGVYGVHDLMCHMYGPTKCFMTIHVEVDSNANVLESHELIDSIENDVKKKYGVEITIHMDPVVLNDPELTTIKEKLKIIIKEIDNELSFHDLRTITKSNSRTLLFDVVVPYKFKYSNEEIKKMIEEKLGNECNYNLVIDFDYQFVSH